MPQSNDDPNLNPQLTETHLAERMLRLAEAAKQGPEVFRAAYRAEFPEQFPNSPEPRD